MLNYIKRWASRPFFICFSGLQGLAGLVMLKDVVTTVGTAVAALEYELVDIERTARGLLRVFIDKPAGISVEDCALVSNHLSRVLAVEEIDYDCLEVSSPGLERPLKRVADFVRFTGRSAKVRLNTLVDNRRRFEGLIESADDAAITFRLVEVASVAIGKPAAKKKQGAKTALSDKTISVKITDIERAHLIPES